MIYNLFFYLIFPILISTFFLLKDFNLNSLFQKKILKIENTICEEITLKEFLREFDLFLIYENKKIVDKIFLNFSKNRNKNLELLIKSWINFYQQETGNFIDLNFCILDSNLAIIDLKIHEIEKINKSIIEEFYLFESIKETVLKEFPFVENFYFFDNETLIESKNLFLNKEFENLNFKEKSEEISEEKPILLIPLISNKKKDITTNKILNNYFLKNYFQEIEINNKNLKIINLENYSENWCKKIKSLNSKIIFLNIFEGKKDSINLIFNTNENSSNSEEFKNEINIFKNFCNSKKINFFKTKIPCKANILINESIILDIEIKNLKFILELKDFLKNFTY